MWTNHTQWARIYGLLLIPSDMGTPFKVLIYEKQVSIKCHFSSLMQPLPANRPLIAAARTASEPTFFPCIAHLFRLRNYLGEKRFSHLFFSSSGIYLTNVFLLLRSKNWKASPTLNRGVTTFDLLTYARAKDVRRGDWKRIPLATLQPSIKPPAENHMLEETWFDTRSAWHLVFTITEGLFLFCTLPNSIVITFNYLLAHSHERKSFAGSTIKIFFWFQLRPVLW